MQKLSRLTTGIIGLDEILAGGFIAGASYIIQGQPGAGKTILSNQIAFQHIEDGGKVLYVTLLAETHERLFQALDALKFFDRDKLGSRIVYVSVFETVRTDGLDAVVKLLRRETKRQEATLLIFDGLLNVRDRAKADFDIKTFVAEIQSQAAFVGCSVLFLTSCSVDEISPEHTMVDGVVQLTDSLMGVRSVRQIQIRKSRGSKAVSGLHEFEITDDGITVFPRIEALARHNHDRAPVAMGKISTGIPRFDALLNGGLPTGSITLLAGPTGSGKTTLGLHFLSLSTPQEPGLHFGFYETPERLRAKAEALGIALPGIGNSALTLIWTPLADNILDKMGHSLLDQVQALGIKRLFIDGMSGFERGAIHKSRLIEFFAALADRLRKLGVSTLATWESRTIVSADVSAPAKDISAIFDNMILLRQVEDEHRFIRSISVQKIRDSDFDSTTCRIDFAEGGLIADPLSSPTSTRPPAPPTDG